MSTQRNEQRCLKFATSNQKEHIPMNPNTYIYRLARRIALACLALVIFLTAATAGAAPSPTAPAGPDFAAIEAYIAAEMREQRIPGLALGIVQGDQIVHLKGFGIADPSGRPVTPQMPFMIGSVTKSFTALAIMQLVEQGKVDLDAPIQRYLPWFRVADATASAQITVRHLLNMTSGLSRATGNQFQASRDMRADALERQARWLSTARLTQPVGAAFQYSNANLWPLGMLIQTVSGQPYDVYIQQHILAPLEMRQSFTSVADAQAQGMAMGYRYWFGRYLPADPQDSGHHRGMLQEGGVISSAEDMAHYLIAYLNQGRYNGKPILSPAGMAEIQRPAVPMGESADRFYAMGLEVGPINGVPTVSHDGSMFNFHANLVLIPEGRWGIIVLENAENLPDEFGPQRLRGIATGVTSLLMGRRPPPAASSWFVVILYSAILGIIVVQAVGILRSVALLRRWRAQPEEQPRGWLGIGRRVVLPLISNAIWGLIILVGLPRVFAPLPALVLGMPDLGPLLVGSGVVALGWSILRTALAVLVLRKSSAPRAIRTPVKA
jgi:CubicO group peptidase (beta-lactamase class C family)